jgi:hypothetical protein
MAYREYFTEDQFANENNILANIYKRDGEEEFRKILPALRQNAFAITNEDDFATLKNNGTLEWLGNIVNKNPDFDVDNVTYITPKDDVYVEPEMRTIFRQNNHNAQSPIGYNYKDTVVTTADVYADRKETDYYSVKMDEIKEALDHPVNVSAGEMVLLYGPTGSRKTSMAKQYAEETGRRLIIEQMTGQTTTGELVGELSIVDGKFMVPNLYTAVKEGAVLLLDELDTANKNTLLALKMLRAPGETMYFKNGEAVVVHEDFRIIATANSIEGYSEEYLARSPFDLATLHSFYTIELDPMSNLNSTYGDEYISRIDNVSNLTPRQIEREIRKLKIKDEG